MTCREFSDFILDYLSDELPEDSRARFERHLTRCPHCPEYLRQYKESISASRIAFAHPDEPLPASVPEELVAAILAATRRG